jgi:hypothetical protein
MARNPASNPTPTPGRSAYPGGVKGNSAQKKVGGTQRRTPTVSMTGAPSSGQRTTGRAVTTNGGGGTGGLPRGQQANPGRQGLPPSGFQTQQGVQPVPGGDEGGYA